MRKIKIADRIIGDEEACFIIAEAGSNHNGSLEQAKKLIDIAQDAGVDAVKFQIFKAEELSADKKVQGVLKKFEFTRGWIQELSEYAKRKNIIFLATPFDIGAVDLLDGIDVPAFKIASGDLTDLPLIKYIAEKGKPIILSVGLGSLEEIREALEVIHSTETRDVALLHCVVNYPAEPDNVNLNVIKTLKQFHVPVGFSDHTMEISVPIAAVALGACIIEKHFTIDRKLEGPDHSYALEPEELKGMVKGIKTVEKALGSEIKQVAESERKGLVGARRSIHAIMDISKGTTITKDMIKIVRPCTGIEPKYLNQILNTKAKKNILKDGVIIWNDLEKSINNG